MGDVETSAKRVGESVYATDAGIEEGESGEVAAVAHGSARGAVGTMMYRRTQRRGDQADGLQRQRLANG